MHKIRIKVLQVLVSPPINKALIGFLQAHSSNTNYQVTPRDRIDGANTDGAKIETAINSKHGRGCRMFAGVF